MVIRVVFEKVPPSLFTLGIRNNLYLPLRLPSTTLGTIPVMNSSHRRRRRRRRRRSSGSILESNPRPLQLQQLVIKTNASDGWEESWKQGVTPRDLGRSTPVVSHLHRRGSLPIGRVLVPGCGTGYDVVAMACPGRYVVGLEISEEAIKKAKQMSSSFPSGDCFTFLTAYFFTWHPTD